MQSIERADASDLEAVLRVLKTAELPEDGVAEHFDSFGVVRGPRGLLGAVGLERYGTVGLLRSLVVAPEARGLGLGARLTAFALESARAHRLQAVYLLTTTAAGFFPRFGFEVIDRAALPSELQASRELQGACCRTAVAMRLSLRREEALKAPSRADR